MIINDFLSFLQHLTDWRACNAARPCPFGNRGVKYMRKMMIVAALAAAATPAVAQNVNVGGGLVDVTVQDVNVLNDSLNANQIEILNNNNVAVPINVQLPIGIAANVCGIAANVLAADLKQDGSAECTATSGSSALGQQILRQKVRQNR